MIVLARAIGLHVHVELDPLDRHLGAASDVQVIAIDVQEAKLARDLVVIGAEVDEGGDEHVAGRAGREVEVEMFHAWRGWASSLIAFAA